MRDAPVARLSDRPAEPLAFEEAPLGLRGDEVRIVPYQPEWPRMYEAEAEKLQELLEELNFDVAIGHVGSTAVPSLAAKPIIDIVLGVDAPKHLGPLLERLIKSDRDYIKAGNRPGMLLVGKDNPRTFLYHLVVRGTPAWDRLVLVRDELRRHPGLAREYETLKRVAARDHPASRLDYSKVKSIFINAILNRGHLERRRAGLTRATRRQATRLDRDLELLDGGEYRPPEAPADPGKANAANDDRGNHHDELRARPGDA